MKSKNLLLLTALFLSFIGVVNVEGHTQSDPKWQARTVVYYVNPQSVDVSVSNAEAAIQTSAAAWSAQPRAFIDMLYGGRVPDTSLEFDGRNVVIFRNTRDSGALATTYWWDNGTYVVDADIVVWEGDYSYITGPVGTPCSRKVFLEDVMAHEFGHLLGIEHMTATDATLYPFYSYCSTAQRSLAPDDIAVIETLYPTGSGTANSAPVITIARPVDGSVVAPGTPITITASAMDLADGNISSRLIWTSNLAGQIGSGGSFAVTLAAGTHLVTASITDSGGLTTSKQLSLTVGANTAPVVSITQPASGTAVTAEVGIIFSGIASDQEEGDLTPGLVWDSNLSGQFGQGGLFTATLPVGTHTITATSVDNSGLVDSKQISLIVNGTVPGSDTPTTSITSPTEGSTVSGTVTIQASASENTGVSRVDFLVDGIVLGSDISTPYSLSWDTTSYTNASHTLTTKAYDASGNVGTSPSVAVTINNTVPSDTSSPSTPQNLVATVGSAEVQLAWSASTDNVGVTGYEIWRNNILLTTIGSVPGFLNTTVTPGSTYTYFVKAFDATGNRSSASNSITVTVPSSTQKPPQIKGKSIVVTQVSAGANITISWETDVISTGLVNYGTGILNQTVSDPNTTTNHSVTIPGNQYPSNTKVFYQIQSSIPNTTITTTFSTKNFRVK